MSGCLLCSRPLEPRFFERSRSTEGAPSTRFLAGGALNRDILVLAGTGNNGGGMVAARHLSNMGSRVRVLLAAPAEELVDVPAHQASGSCTEWG